MLRIYIWKCICLSSRTSWLAVNGVVGSAFGGAVMTWQGAVQFFNESSGSFAKGANIFISTIAYAIPAFFALFVLHACFISPFFVWKAEREARIKAEAAGNNRENRKNVRITLGRFIPAAESLMARCIDEAIIPPNDEASVWGQHVEAFLLDNLDESYIARFRNGSNMIPTLPAGMSSRGHINLRHGLQIRIFRLNEFMKELSI